MVQLWDRNSQRVTQIDTGEKALTFLAWSKTGPELAIGRSNFAMGVVNGAVYAVGGDANQSRSGVLGGVETLRP